MSSGEEKFKCDDIRYLMTEDERNILTIFAQMKFPPSFRGPIISVLLHRLLKSEGLIDEVFPLRPDFFHTYSVGQDARTMGEILEKNGFKSMISPRYVHGYTGPNFNVYIVSSGYEGLTDITQDGYLRTTGEFNHYYSKLDVVTAFQLMFNTSVLSLELPLVAESQIYFVYRELIENYQNAGFNWDHPCAHGNQVRVVFETDGTEIELAQCQCPIIPPKPKFSELTLNQISENIVSKIKDPKSTRNNILKYAELLKQIGQLETDLNQLE